MAKAINMDKQIAFESIEKLVDQGSFPKEYADGYKDGYKQADKLLQELKTKYDNILATDEWLDESGTPVGIKQINREWLCDILIEFTIAYIKSANKDIANDASEYLYDKLKDTDMIYILSDDESAAGREDAVEFAEWLNKHYHQCEITDLWKESAKTSRERHTIAELYTIFKQQKEK